MFEADLKGRHSGLLGLWHLAKELKLLKFDVVADFHNVLRSNILKIIFFFFGKQTVQINKDRAEKKALVTGKHFKQLKTSHQRYADVLEGLGFPVDLSNPTFPERASLDEELVAFIGKDTKRWIGVAPFAAFAGKVYPIDLMETVIDDLSKRYKVLLFGAGKEEELLLKKLSENKSQVLNLAGKFSLSQELDIISNLDLMVAMDSGNAHMAAMIGIEVVTIWGVTHPYAGFYPFNQSKQNAALADRRQYPQIPTSVYGKTLPKGYENILRSVSPEQVIAKVEHILT